MARLEKSLQAIPAVPPNGGHQAADALHAVAYALGALLFRAGRIDDAITRLNEGMAAAREWHPDGSPGDWIYLAVAHARKGDHAEARRWLERLRRWSPAPRISFWDIQELALLRDEAESLVLDAGFPGDPFRAARAVRLGLLERLTVALSSEPDAPASEFLGRPRDPLAARRARKDSNMPSCATQVFGAL